ncbi:MAG: PDZ domain-containing protein [Candidatus Omnitrophota bacterium]
MKKRLLFLLLVIVVIAGLEVVALLSKPKVAFKVNTLGDNLDRGDISPKQGNVPFFVEESRGLSPTFEEQVKVKVEDILRLELIGTAMGNGKDPTAFIKNLDSGKQGIYKLGSTIQEAKVIKISMGKVVLDVKGKVQVLTIGSTSKTLAHLNKAGQQLITVSGDQIMVNKSSLASESAKIINELTRVRVSPYFESLKVAGLKLEGVTPDSIIASAGIHNKDVVTMVNSQKIDSYQKALQVLNKAKGQTEIKISVLRDGQPQLLCYKVQ